MNKSMPEEHEDNDLGVVESYSDSSNVPRPKARGREDTRRNLAIMIFWLIVAISVLLIAGRLLGVLDTQAVKDLASVVLLPIVGIFGTVIGFFFGSQSEKLP